MDFLSMDFLSMDFLSMDFLSMDYIADGLFVDGFDWVDFLVYSHKNAMVSNICEISPLIVDSQPSRHQVAQGDLCL